jgi:ArsR family transcriptional regulator, arsenate/arsenite/antimonite-responsive transcriptional repressor
MNLRLDLLFKALADPTRLRILNLLKLGSICVCEMHAVLQLPQPTVSRHLAALRHAGLVRDCRRGTRIIYSLAPADNHHLSALFELLSNCFPCDDDMKADLARLNKAVREGICRLDPYPSDEESTQSASVNPVGTVYSLQKFG